MDVDTEPPMDGPGEGPQLCEPIGVDADDASDGDGADASDAGDPRLILGSHRALDAIGGFVPPTDLQALRVVSKTASDSRVLVATKRVVTQRWTACAASNKRARRRLEAVEAMGRFLGPDAESFLTAMLRDDKLQTVRAAAATWLRSWKFLRNRCGISRLLNSPPYTTTRGPFRWSTPIPRSPLPMSRKIDGR